MLLHLDRFVKSPGKHFILFLFANLLRLVQYLGDTLFENPSMFIGLTFRFRSFDMTIQFINYVFDISLQHFFSLLYSFDILLIILR